MAKKGHTRGIRGKRKAKFKGKEMKKLLCRLTGHKWYKGFYQGYAWEICERCKKPGRQLIGKPKKKVSK